MAKTRLDNAFELHLVDNDIFIYNTDIPSLARPTSLLVDGVVLMLRYIQSLLGDRILEARGMPPFFLDIVAALLIILGG